LNGQECLGVGYALFVGFIPFVVVFMGCAPSEPTCYEMWQECDERCRAEHDDSPRCWDICSDHYNDCEGPDADADT